VSLPVKHNTIRTFALICVALTSGWMIWLTWWLIDLLSGNDWCAIAVGVSEAANARPLEAIQSCFSLLDAQVGWLGWALMVSLVSLALCLVVLMVIVVAGGKLSFSASKSGVSGAMGREELPEKAQGAVEAAEAAGERAEEIIQEEAPQPKGTDILE
jgi:TRAP-type C4-dicarboxylate transport system permease small subunit